MGIYRIDPIGGGTGFKVHVADATGSLRIVGIFFSETDAAAWIEADRHHTARAGRDRQLEPVPQS